MFLLHSLLKDMCMCLQDEWKLWVTRPAEQVQYLNIFVPCKLFGQLEIFFHRIYFNPATHFSESAHNVGFFQSKCCLFCRPP